MYDAKSLIAGTADKGAGKKAYIIHKEDIIPPTKQRIQEVLTTPWVLPDELIDVHAQDPSDAPIQFIKEAQKGITDDFCLSWFKRALSLQLGGGYHLWITTKEKVQEA